MKGDQHELVAVKGEVAKSQVEDSNSEDESHILPRPTIK
jgi:hypothetical protein